MVSETIGDPVGDAVTDHDWHQVVEDEHAKG